MIDLDEYPEEWCWKWKKEQMCFKDFCDGGDTIAKHNQLRLHFGTMLIPHRAYKRARNYRIMLMRLHHYSFREIAQRMGISIVRTRLLMYNELKRMNHRLKMRFY